MIAASSVKGTYDTVIDRESAYEKVKGRATASADAAAAGGAPAGGVSGIQSRDRWAVSRPEPAARTAWRKLPRRAPRARSARPWVAKSCAASWDRCWAGAVSRDAVRTLGRGA